MWLADSLNWEKTSSIVSFDWSLTAFIFQPTFLSSYFFNDYASKLSALDVTLISAGSNFVIPQKLYTAFVGDYIGDISINFLPLSPLLQTEYQEPLNSILLLSPELALAFGDYILYHIVPPTLNVSPSATFDAFAGTLNFYYGEGLIQLFFYFLYIYVFIYFFLILLSLRWSNFVSVHFLRFYYYFYSISKESRIQFEAFTQTILFFILYWGMVLMAFDDDQEEVIEFIDTSFFNFLSIIILFLCYRFSIHYFAFLEASIVDGRTTVFLLKQFFRDSLNTFSVVLRFYILVLRINIYDVFDDILDSYYIFIIDFDDDEYLNELFMSLHGVMFFAGDNHDDRSFLLEDENGFMFDLFYLYFLM